MVALQSSQCFAIETHTYVSLRITQINERALIGFHSFYTQVSSFI